MTKIAKEKALSSLGLEPNVAPKSYARATGPTYLPDAPPPAWRAPLEAAKPVLSFARVPVKERANVLHVELNRISKLKKPEPERLALLPNLGRVLMIEYDTAMRQRVLATLATLPKMQWLTYSHASPIDPEIAQLRHLRSLGLRVGHLAPPVDALPEALRALTELEHLELWGRNLTTLPSWLGAFERLRYLGLLDVPLVSLPDDLALPNLRVLLLRHDTLDLARICENAAALPSLVRLGLQHRHGGQELPPSIGRLKGLVWLKAGTDLTALPRELFTLPKLRFLSLEFNDLDRLPEDLTNLPSLETLDLQGNRRLDVAQAVDVALRVPTLRGLSLPNAGLVPASAKKLIDAGFLQASSMSGDMWIRGGPVARWQSIEND